ncbi:MAG: hypothetical protein JSS60_01685 [Verrucomicrobia bacterium]|nr:hypothetical protein [Verrucomicrobiota bacterium]
MGDLDKNIHRKESPTPYEKIIVNPIEGDKKEKEEGYTGLGNSTRSQVFATLVSYFKKMLTAFAFRGRGLSFSGDQQHLLENVLAFRQLLIILSGDDQSHNPDFTQQLSELWHNLLDDCNSLASSPHAPVEIVNKVKFFISQVQNFPPGADHTLGFYFDEYAGKDWIPFPFMELLQGLHEEYNASPVISVLYNWTALLNDILNSAGVKID